MRLLSHRPALALTLVAAVSAFSGEKSSTNGSLKSQAPVLRGLTPSPGISFESPGHDFGKVKAGIVVRHEFLFKNTGNALLELTGVHPSCSSCLAVPEWSQRVEPGKTGKILVEFNSSQFQGLVRKSVSVVCNDPSQRRITLNLQATVWEPLEIIPRFAVLNAVANSTNVATAVLRIVNHEEQPLTVSEPVVQHRSFAATLETVTSGREFDLRVMTVPPLVPGDVQGRITVKTSSTNFPSIDVTAFAVVQPALKVTPLQIAFPVSGSNSVTRTVSIRNIDSRAVILSEPKVNAPGVDVSLREIEPGRQFVCTVVFPPGFTPPSNSKLELSIRSSHPDFEFIKVPAVRLPPAAPIGRRPAVRSVTP